MSEAEIAAALSLLDLQVPESRLPQVAQQLERIAQIAAPVLAVALAPEDEPAPIWRP